MSEEIKKGTPIVATYGFNPVLDKPYEFLYEFGYYAKNGCVVYKQGKHSFQDSYAFKLLQIRIATKEDLQNLFWGK